MGQLIVQQFVTADGFAADRNNEFKAFELLDGGTAELEQSQLEWLASVEAMVLGANTYRMFLEYWPTPASAGMFPTGHGSNGHALPWCRTL